MAASERRAVLVVAALLATGLLVLLVLRSPDAQARATTASHWAVAPGFSLSTDTTGYEMPTGLAFVPRPGRSPKDPLYFVIELRGRVKVVANDRTVRVFATVPAFRAVQALPRGSQSGLAGICLDPDRGYVFVTYTYEDRGGVLRNNITRFATRPGSFGPRPTAKRTFTSVFADFQAAPAHQIGSCHVRDGRLFVGVGDGGNPSAAADLDQLLGKLLCLTVDGLPCATNPFAGDRRPRRFVWAHGFRNPFGVEVVRDRVFVAENGVNIDRFFAARRGQSHHWNGSDASIGVGADVVFYPPFSPVQLTHHAAGVLPRAWRNTFLMAAAGDLGFRTSDQTLFVGVLGLGYTAELDGANGPPRRLVQYRGTGVQSVAGVDVGPDGIYFAELLATDGGTSSVLRVRHDPDDEHEFVIGSVEGGARGRLLMEEYGCTSCHALGDGEGGGGIGPTLDSFGLSWRLRPRLESDQYRREVARVDGLHSEPFRSYRDERRRVLELDGNERVIEWITYKIVEPKFDDPNAQMPDLGVSREDAETIATYLGESFQRPTTESNTFLDRVKRRRKAVGFGLVVGVFASAATGGVALFALWVRRRRTSAG